MTEARAISDGRYVLIKRGLYWKPNSQGYTALLSEAGIYSDEESRGYAGGAHDGMTYRVPASEAEDIAPGANDESKARYWKGKAAAMAEELMALREAVKPFGRLPEIPQRFADDAVVQAAIEYTMDAEEVDSLQRLSGGALKSDRASLIVSIDGLTAGDFRRAAKAVPNV